MFKHLTVLSPETVNIKILANLTGNTKILGYTVNPIQTLVSVLPSSHSPCEHTGKQLQSLDKMLSDSVNKKKRENGSMKMTTLMFV